VNTSRFSQYIGDTDVIARFRVRQLRLTVLVHVTSGGADFRFLAYELGSNAEADLAPELRTDRQRTELFEIRTSHSDAEGAGVSSAKCCQLTRLRA